MFIQDMQIRLRWKSDFHRGVNRKGRDVQREWQKAFRTRDREWHKTPEFVPSVSESVGENVGSEITSKYTTDREAKQTGLLGSDKDEIRQRERKRKREREKERARPPRDKTDVACYVMLHCRGKREDGD